MTEMETTAPTPAPDDKSDDRTRLWYAVALLVFSGVASLFAAILCFRNRMEKSTASKDCGSMGRDDVSESFHDEPVESGKPEFRKVRGRSSSDASGPMEDDIPSSQNTIA